MNPRIFSFTAMVFFLLIVCGCNKPPGEREEDLRISTDAINNKEVLGPDYPFNVTVESKMPESGVIISVTVVGESDNGNYSPISNIQTTAKTTRIGLHTLPQQVYCLVSIRVTSKTKSTNTIASQFRIIRKS